MLELSNLNLKNVFAALSVILLLVLCFQSFPGIVSGQDQAVETYTLVIAKAGYLNILIPPDSTVENIDLQQANGTAGAGTWKYWGTFSLRGHRFAQISTNGSCSLADTEMVTVTMQVRRNAFAYVPAEADSLSDTLLRFASQYSMLGHIDPCEAFGNLDKLDEWRGYPLLDVGRGFSPSELPAGGVNMVVITSNQIQASTPLLSAFLQLKQSQGIVPFVMTVEAIGNAYEGGSVQEKTLQFLRDAYNTWHMEYVLIVGGQATLPGITFQRYEPLSKSIDTVSSDFYYSVLEQPTNSYTQTTYPLSALQYPSDMPDFIVGRLPSDDTQEIQNILDKTMTYEQTTPGNWIKNRLLVSGQEWYPSATQTEWTMNMPAPQLQLIYPMNLTTQTLIDAMNEGVGAVFVNTHADPYAWWLSQDHIFAIQHVADLTNTDKYFVVFSDGCHSGKWDVPSSLPVSLLAAQRKGAVAIVAGTDYGPYGIDVGLTAYNSIGKDRLFLARLPDANYHIGEALYYFTAMNGIVNYMNILGDPSLVMPVENAQDTPPPTTTTATTNSTLSTTETTSAATETNLTTTETTAPETNSTNTSTSTTAPETAITPETTTTTASTTEIVSTTTETGPPTTTTENTSTSETSTSETAPLTTDSETGTVTSSGSFISQPSPQPRSGCIIATATFGSPMAPEVAHMRYVRDKMIGSTPTGKVLVGGWNWFYYLWSPPVAAAIASSSMLQVVFRVLLLPLIGTIHVAGWVFTALGGGDFASVGAFAAAAGLSVVNYILFPAMVVRRVRRKREKKKGLSDTQKVN